MKNTIKTTAIISIIARIVVMIGLVFAYQEPMLLSIFLVAQFVGFIPDIATIANLLFNHFKVGEAYIQQSILLNKLTSSPLWEAPVFAQRFATPETHETTNNQLIAPETKLKRFGNVSASIEGHSVVKAGETIYIDAEVWDRERLENSRRTARSQMNDPAREASATKRNKLYSKAIEMLDGYVPDDTTFTWEKRRAEA